MIVVDASALLEVLLRTRTAKWVEERLLDMRHTLHAPHLLDVEIAQVIQRYALAGEIDQESGRDALRDLGDLPIQRYPHTLFLSRIWDLRNIVTAYDAVYISLAEALGAPLLTCDQRLARASGHRARIEVVQSR